MLRDLWWLIAAVVAFGVAACFFMSPVIGVGIILIGVFVPLYFSFLRYDDQGNQRPRI